MSRTGLRVPLVWYLGVGIGVPLLNGGYARAEFAAYAVWVIATALALSSFGVFALRTGERFGTPAGEPCGARSEVRAYSSPMADTPSLLNDDGTASMATALMMSHHAFRRDLLQFETALARVAAGDVSRVDALREEWRSFRETLHGHHDAEDTRLFPHVQSQVEKLVSTIERLSTDHEKMDSLLEQGDRAFAALPDTGEARAVIGELVRLLAPHLALEEAEVIPVIREAKHFPPPATEEEAALFASGFAWSSQGVAPDILERVDAMLPETMREKLRTARSEFEARWRRVWGVTAPMASRTPVPEGWDAR